MVPSFVWRQPAGTYTEKPLSSRCSRQPAGSGGRCWPVGPAPGGVVAGASVVAAGEGAVDGLSAGAEPAGGGTAAPTVVCAAAVGPGRPASDEVSRDVCQITAPRTSTTT